MTAGRSWLLSWTKMRRTSRTLLGWSKSTRSSWTRTRVCPCTTRTAKNSWNSFGYSNRRDRGHPDQAEMKLNCPQHPPSPPPTPSTHPSTPSCCAALHCTTLTLSYPIFCTHTHISVAFCILFSQTWRGEQVHGVQTDTWSGPRESSCGSAAGWDLYL